MLQHVWHKPAQSVANFSGTGPICCAAALPVGCCSKVDIVLEGGLPVLIDMMHSADVETAHQGTGVVANLAEVVENQGKMVESGEELET